MVTILWTDVVLYLALALAGGWGLGMWTAVALRLWRREPPGVWDRATREADQARWRDGSPVDAQFRGVRWLPRQAGDDD
jgi:hypothetical protein